MSYQKMAKPQLIDLLIRRDELLHRRDSEIAQLRADVARLKREAGQAPSTSWETRMAPMRDAAKQLAKQLGRSVTREEVLAYMQAR